MIPPLLSVVTQKLSNFATDDLICSIAMAVSLISDTNLIKAVEFVKIQPANNFIVFCMCRR